MIIADRGSFAIASDPPVFQFNDQGRLMGFGTPGDGKRVPKGEVKRVMCTNHAGRNYGIEVTTGASEITNKARVSTCFFAEMRKFFLFWEGFGVGMGYKLLVISDLFFGTGFTMYVLLP
jgi:hypothetical protein